MQPLWTLGFELSHLLCKMDLIEKSEYNVLEHMHIVQHLRPKSKIAVKLGCYIDTACLLCLYKCYHKSNLKNDLQVNNHETVNR